MRPDLDAFRYECFTNFLGQKRYFTKEWGTFGNYQKNGAEMVISQKNWGKNGIIPKNPTERTRWKECTFHARDIP